MQANGAPVTGTVMIKAELAYTNDLNDVLCSEIIPGVVLTNGVFHVKLSLNCTVPVTFPTRTLTQVLAQTPANETVAIRITDISHSKQYSYQALHSLPFANVASQLVQMGASEGQFLKWKDSEKKWVPVTVAAATGGTVTNVSVNSPLTISNPTSTPSIGLPQANGTTSGYLSSADWNAFNSKQGALPAGGTNAHYYRGDNSWQTLDTSVVPENTNLYFTNARALGVPLTGFTTATGAIVATDTALEAFGKAQGQINSLVTDSSKYLIKNTTDSITGVVNVGTTGLLQLVYTPVGMNDAVNKTYADSKLSLSGGTLSGALNLDNDLKIKGGANYVTVKAHATTNAYDFILPQTAGTSGYVLQTDGSGNLSWINPSSVAAGSGTVNSGSITDGSIVDADINISAAIAQSKILNLTNDLAAKVSTTLTNGNILIGNGSNVATAVLVSGDATLSNSGVLTLANTGTAGTYKSVTVDAKGRVTAGTNPTTLAGYGITDAVTGVTVTAPVTNSGTALAPVIAMPVATTSANGYLSSSDFTTFNNKQDAIISSTAINAGSFTSNLQGGLIVKPHSTGAGDTGEIQLKELVAGGSNYTGFKAPDALAGNVIYTLPSVDGSSGQVLTTNSSGGLSWTTVATSSTNLTGDIGGSIGANTIGAGKVTLTHLSATGTKDNTTYLRGDNTFATLANDVRAVALTGLSTTTNAVITVADTVLTSLGKLQKQISDFAVSAVGGDLSGNLPNPTVAKIQGKAVSNAAPLAGQVLKYNTGTPAWEPSYVLVGDLKSSALGNLFPGTGCAANQTLYYSVVGDAFTCVNIDSLDAGKITTGTIAAARLPSSATYWQVATGGINYGSGNVGIANSSPTYKLHVGGNAYENNVFVTSSLQVAESSATNRAHAFLSTNNAQAIVGGNIRLNPNITTGTHIGYEKGTNERGSAGIVFETQSAGNGYFRFLTATDTNDDTYTVSEPLTILPSGNVGIGVTNPTAKLDVDGGLNISGTGQRITGDFTNATLANRVMFQSSSVNGATAISAIPNGTSNTSLFAVHTSSDPDNSSLGMLLAQSNITLRSAKYGTGTLLPITFEVGSGLEKMRIDTTGNIGIGTTTPSQKLDVVGNIQSADTFYTSVTYADGWAVGDYKELVVAASVGAAGSSGLYKVALSTTRGNWTEATTFTTIGGHSDPDVWREIPASVVNYYTTYSYRCFTVDANSNAYVIKFRVRAIRPSSDCSAVSSGVMPVYFKVSSEGYNGSWSALTATGTGATVTGYRTTNGSEWNLYTGASKNAGLPTITAKEGQVGIGTISPAHKLDVRGRIASVNPSGLNSGGDYIGFATETGELPGYPASAYSIIKTNSQYVYFSVNGSYSSYISAGGAYTAVSDRNKKENFVELDYDDVLRRIDELPITKWNYKAEDKSIKHIGPMAQDFHRLFGLNGSSDKMIAQMDTTGVALAGVKSLSNGLRKIENFIKDFYSEFTSSKKAIANQQAQIDALEKKNAELEARLKKVEENLNRKPASK